MNRRATHEPCKPIKVKHSCVIWFLLTQPLPFLSVLKMRSPCSRCCAVAVLCCCFYLHAVRSDWNTQPPTIHIRTHTQTHMHINIHTADKLKSSGSLVIHGMILGFEFLFRCVCVIVFCLSVGTQTNIKNVCNRTDFALYFEYANHRVVVLHNMACTSYIARTPFMYVSRGISINDSMCVVPEAFYYFAFVRSFFLSFCLLCVAFPVVLHWSELESIIIIIVEYSLIKCGGTMQFLIIPKHSPASSLEINFAFFLQIVRCFNGYNASHCVCLQKIKFLEIHICTLSILLYLLKRVWLCKMRMQNKTIIYESDDFCCLCKVMISRAE